MRTQGTELGVLPSSEDPISNLPPSEILYDFENSLDKMDFWTRYPKFGKIPSICVRFSGFFDEFSSVIHKFSQILK